MNLPDRVALRHPDAYIWLVDKLHIVASRTGERARWGRRLRGQRRPESNWRCSIDESGGRQVSPSWGTASECLERKSPGHGGEEAQLEWRKGDCGKWGATEMLWERTTIGSTWRRLSKSDSLAGAVSLEWEKEKPEKEKKVEGQDGSDCLKQSNMTETCVKIIIMLFFFHVYFLWCCIVYLQFGEITLKHLWVAGSITQGRQRREKHCWCLWKGAEKGGEGTGWPTRTALAPGWKPETIIWRKAK